MDIDLVILLPPSVRKFLIFAVSILYVFPSETCGAPRHDLGFNAPLTILGGHLTGPDGTRTAYFASYLGTSESIPNTTTTSILHPYGTHQIECLWKLTEPPGTRIRVEVVEFSGLGVKLRVGNGEAPSGDTANVVLTPVVSSPFIPTEVLSSSSNVWITLEFNEQMGYLGKLRIVSTVYNITGNKSILKV